MKSIAQPCAGVNAPCGVSTPPGSDPHTTLPSAPVSEALLAANRQLMARRSRETGCAGGIAPCATTPRAEIDTVAVPAILHALPPHLGWGNGRSATVLRAQGVTGGRWTDTHEANEVSGDKHHLRIDISHAAIPEKPKTTVKAYPSILNALLKQEQAAAGRVWLLCRHLDADGRGWIDVTDLRRALTKRKAEGGKRKAEISSFILDPSYFPIFGWRRLRQILGQGKGIFWNRDESGRLWIFGAARVAANLNVERLQNRPIQLPVSDLTGTIGQVRAVFYAAFHAGRRDSQPISRVSIERATGVPARTQFHYEETARIKRRKNYTIGAGWGSVSAENSAYQHGNAVFEFIDYRGRHGKCGQTYAARQLPNSYLTRLQPCTRGRQRKVNARLADLVTWGAGERPEQVFDKLYFRDGVSIVEARAAVGSRDVSYWPQAGDHAAPYTLWHCRVGG